jgi:hypothetical protein
MKTHLEFAMLLVEALLKAYQRKFGQVYSLTNILMATALHPDYTPAVMEVVAREPGVG